MNSRLKKTRVPYALLSAASLAAFGVLIAAAEAHAAEPAGPTATTNVNLVTQYRFRGIDQTWGRLALQGGADLAWPNGLNNAFFRPPTGGLSMANGDTRELDKPMLVLQAGRSF